MAKDTPTTDKPTLVPSTPAAVRMASIQGILTDLPVLTRNKVIAETQAFLSAQQTAANSYLAMGEHLRNVRDVLEPLEKWKAYINLLPNIAQATAYRMIWSFENSAALPPATRRVAILDGYKLISSKKGEAFAPGYEAAVKATIKEVGQPPERDEAKARAWLQSVMQKKRELARKSGTAAASGEQSKHDASAIALAQVEPTEKRILMLVERLAPKLAPDIRKDFGLRLAGMIATVCECPAYKLKPVRVPDEYRVGATEAA